MGYPMTWQRVMSRNGFRDAGEAVWAVNVNTSAQDDAIAAVARMRAERVEQLAARFATLRADVIRLVEDAQDEGPLCQRIAERSGVAADTVAAVLKEFFAE